MLQFYREDNKVKVHIQHGIWGTNQGFVLDINQTYDYQAELLTQALQENLNRHLIALKKKYYEQGWKDAKGKKKKDIYFWGGW